MQAGFSFLQGALFSFSLCFDLGMVNVAIMKSGIERGFKPSFMIGFGSCFGDLFYLSLALLGVSVVFNIPVIRWSLWVAGTIVLTCLTVKMLRETWKPKHPADNPGIGGSSVSLVKDWLTGAGLALSSPSVIAWFAFVAGPIAAGMNITHGAGLIAFVAGFFAAGLVWSLGMALVSSLSGAALGPSMARVLSFVSAILFFYFAVKVFWGGLQELLA